MLTRIIFLIAVATSFLIVLLLALFSPVPDHNPPESLFSFSLYLQQTHIPSSSYRSSHQTRAHHNGGGGRGGGGALIFRRSLTEGPENNSRVVGKVEGFIIPHEDFAKSDFNVIYLTLETPEYMGSVSIRSRDMAKKMEEVMEVVGGTGAFAFARGIAIFAEIDDHGDEEDVTTYRVKLLLRFPHTSHVDPQ